MLKLLMAFPLVSLAFVSGCGEGPNTGPAQTTVTIGDRQVSAYLDVPGELVAEGDRAVVTAGTTKVEIEKSRVVIDGNDSGKIPELASRVDVAIIGQVLTVSADDSVVATLPLKSAKAL